VILAIVVLVYFAFIMLPLAAVFLRINPSLVNSQLQNSQIIEAIKLSLYTSGIATAISICLAVPAAYFLATRRFPGKSIIDTIMDLPIVMPPAVAGVALLYAFAPKGLLGPVLQPVVQAFGLRSIPYSTIAVIIAEIFVASPFLMRSAKTGFENLDKDVLNSARILSGSRLRVFLTVTLPLTTRVIISGIMLTWARAVGEFGATLMFAGNLPGITQTMPLAIYMLMNNDASSGVMLSTILIAISFSVLMGVRLLEQKRFKNR
jgi:molybdate transport system permease protein